MGCRSNWRPKRQGPPKLTKRWKALSIRNASIGAVSIAQVGAALSNVANRLRAHADAHRALLAPAAGGPVDLADYVGQVCASMTRASLAPSGVRLLVDADEIWLESGRSWRVGLIVAELIRNAERHGLAGGPGAIRVSIAEACGSVSCEVSDNGGLTRRGAGPGSQAGRGVGRRARRIGRLVVHAGGLPRTV
jgi:two-component sensor histidine kinase